jgi:predicted dehydrogenase
MARSKKTVIRFAVVGLGHFAQTAILPAFANTRNNAALAALVTGDVEKAAKLKRKYKVPACSYEDYEELLESGDIDAVYIATPNSEHREYAVQAARRGVHVLCEKPLAYNVYDARAICDACEKADVRLMTAYRLHFEAGNLQSVELIKSGRIGDPRLFTSVHTMQVDPDNIRTDLSLGGGPLEDIGIYCLNAARYIFQDEPEEVSAVAVHGSDPRFKEVPETVSVTMQFSGGRLATFLCGFGATKTSEYRVIGTKGTLQMDPAYTWHGDIEQTVTIKGKSTRRIFKHRDQIAAEILYFADCVQKGKTPEPSGREGMIDVRIMDAIRKAAKHGRRVAVSIPKKKPRPDASQSIKRQPHRKPQPVNAAPPSIE